MSNEQMNDERPAPFTRRKSSTPLRTLAERLDDLSTPVTESGCILWMGTNVRGYGQIEVRRPDGSYKKARAHRVAWSLAYGEIPAGMHVLHKCDTPACIRPDHLFLGTNADNTADKVAKGRHPCGEKSSSAKLTEAQVIAIRNDQRPSRVIADEFGVKKTQVGDIRAGRRWKHIQMPDGAMTTPNDGTTHAEGES